MVDISGAFWYAFGLAGLLLLLWLLARPLELALKAAGHSILGGLALWLLNLVGSWFDFHLALNPVSAAVAGMLGVPGVVSLAVLRWMLG